MDISFAIAVICSKWPVWSIYYCSLLRFKHLYLLYLTSNGYMILALKSYLTTTWGSLTWFMFLILMKRIRPHSNVFTLTADHGEEVQWLERHFSFSWLLQAELAFQRCCHYKRKYSFQHAHNRLASHICEHRDLHPKKKLTKNINRKRVGIMCSANARLGQVQQWSPSFTDMWPFLALHIECYNSPLWLLIYTI